MHSLILKNQKVYDFYNNNKHFDFEKMNMLFVDLLESFQEGINHSFNKNDNELASKLSQQIADFQTKILEKQSENNTENILSNLYPSASTKIVDDQKKNSENILLFRKEMNPILIQSKDCEKNVTNEEVQCFLEFIGNEQCNGILLSQKCGITSRENFEIQIYHGKICLFLHNVQYNSEKIRTAVDIIDKLIIYFDKNKFETSKDIRIDLDYAEILNKEYEQFIKHKKIQIKTINDYSNKLLTQLDNMSFIHFEKWLNIYFFNSLSSNQKQVFETNKTTLDCIDKLSSSEETEKPPKKPPKTYFNKN